MTQEGEFEQPDYGEPSKRADSPEMPGNVPLPKLGDRVFVDTNTGMPKPQFISVRAAAAQLGLSVTTVRRRIAAGIMAGRRDPRPGRYQVRASAVADLLELRAALRRSAALPGAVGPREDYRKRRAGSAAPRADTERYEVTVSYELWDRFSGNLILDFGDRESALDFVRRQVTGLDEASAAREVERFALERLVDGESEVLARGTQLLELRAALPGAVGPRADYVIPSTEDERDADGRALDLGIPDMPGYAPLFDELEAAFGSRFTDALWHPDRLGAARDRWPLTAAEVSDLLGRISPELACPTETIAGWAAAGERLPPVPNGPGRVYFARDLVPIAHRLWLVAKMRDERQS